MWLRTTVHQVNDDGYDDGNFTHDFQGWQCNTANFPAKKPIWIANLQSDLHTIFISCSSFQEICNPEANQIIFKTNWRMRDWITFEFFSSLYWRFQYDLGSMKNISLLLAITITVKRIRMCLIMAQTLHKIRIKDIIKDESNFLTHLFGWLDVWGFSLSTRFLHCFCQPLRKQ